MRQPAFTAKLDAQYWGTAGNPQYWFEQEQQKVLATGDVVWFDADDGGGYWAMVHESEDGGVGYLAIGNDPDAFAYETIQYAPLFGEGASPRSLANGSNPGAYPAGLYFDVQFKDGLYHRIGPSTVAPGYPGAISLAPGVAPKAIWNPAYGWIVDDVTWQTVQAPWARAQGGSALESVFSNAPIIIASVFAVAAIGGALAGVTVSGEAALTGGFITDAELAAAAAEASSFEAALTAGVATDPVFAAEFEELLAEQWLAEMESAEAVAGFEELVALEDAAAAVEAVEVVEVEAAAFDEVMAEAAGEAITEGAVVSAATPPILAPELLAPALLAPLAGGGGGSADRRARAAGTPGASAANAELVTALVALAAVGGVAWFVMKGR